MRKFPKELLRCSRADMRPVMVKDGYHWWHRWTVKEVSFIKTNTFPDQTSAFAPWKYQLTSSVPDSWTESAWSNKAWFKAHIEAHLSALRWLEQGNSDPDSTNKKWHTTSFLSSELMLTHTEMHYLFSECYCMTAVLCVFKLSPRPQTFMQLSPPESVHGVSICTMATGMMGNCRIVSFTRASRERLSGQQVDSKEHLIWFFLGHFAVNCDELVFILKFSCKTI